MVEHAPWIGRVWVLALTEVLTQAIQKVQALYQQWLKVVHIICACIDDHCSKTVHV